MSTTIDPGAVAAKYGALNSMPPPQSDSSGATDGQDSAAIAAKYGALNVSADDTGQVTNDVGNTVIVPKEGEDFASTVRRAVSRQNALSPQQKQAEIDKETATMPAKTAQTLAGAATIGVAGPAALAGTGELMSAAPGATKAVLDFLEQRAAEYAANYPHLIGLAKALGISAGPAGALLYLHKLAGK